MLNFSEKFQFSIFCVPLSVSLSKLKKNLRPKLFFFCVPSPTPFNVYFAIDYIFKLLINYETQTNLEIY